MVADKWYEPFSKPFPQPFSKFENESCYYNEPRQNNARFPTRQACGSHSHGTSFGETTYESAKAYQGSLSFFKKSQLSLSWQTELSLVGCGITGMVLEMHSHKCGRKWRPDSRGGLRWWDSTSSTASAPLMYGAAD